MGASTWNRSKRQVGRHRIFASSSRETGTTPISRSRILSCARTISYSWGEIDSSMEIKRARTDDLWSDVRSWKTLRIVSVVAIQAGLVIAFNVRRVCLRVVSRGSVTTSLS
jgi:hypothetical protein